MINLRDINDIINSDRNNFFFEKMEKYMNKYSELIETDLDMKHSFAQIIKYIIKDEPFLIYIRTDYSRMNNQHVPPNLRLPLKIEFESKPLIHSTYMNPSPYESSNKFVLKKFTTSMWGNGIDYFTNLPGYSEIGGSFLNCLFDYPGVYEEFYTHLTDDGIEFFSKLKEQYDKVDFNQVIGCKIKTPLTNITKDETEILNINPGAYISIAANSHGVSLFISNKIFSDTNSHVVEINSEFTCFCLISRKNHGFLHLRLQLV